MRDDRAARTPSDREPESDATGYEERDPDVNAPAAPTPLRLRDERIEHEGKAGNVFDHSASMASIIHSRKQRLATSGPCSR